MAFSSLVPWRRREEENPWLALRSEMDRLFEDFSRGMGSSMWPSEFAGEDVRQFRLDFAEDEKSYMVTAELPGIDEKDVEVTLQNDTLLIRGEKKFEKEDKKKNYHRVERSYGTFQRAIRLPSEVKADEVKAKFKNGVLELTIPKSKTTQEISKKIPIETK